MEHILPKNVAAIAGWEHFNNDERRTYRRRIGNLVLLDTKDNGAIGDKPFSVKRPIIAKCQNLRLTADVINRTEDGSTWTKEHIEERNRSWLI